MASIRLVVEHGADVNFATPDGANQALKTAAENDRLEACEFLLASGAMPDLITAAMLGLPDRVDALASAHPDAIHQLDSHGRSALDAATLHDAFRNSRSAFHIGHDGVAEILIRHGAALEIAHAASLGRLDDVRGMVERDPDILRRRIELVARVGGTAVMESPLEAATRKGNREMVDFLLKHGAVLKPRIVWA